MKKIIFFISCFFLMTNATSAITIDCPEVASPGEKIICHIEDDSYIGIKAKYNLGKFIRYKDASINSSFKVYYKGTNGFTIGNVKDDNKLSMDLELTVNMNIATNQDYSISLEDIEVSTLDGKYEKKENVSETIKILSDINTLDNLEVVGGELTPAFDKEIISYESIVDSDKTEIKATPTDKDATIEGDIGLKNLDYGVNNFSIKVTSPRGTEKIYSIYVTRPIKDSDITLKKLEITNVELEFDKDKFFYEADVTSKIDSVDVIAEATSKTSTVKIEKTDKLEIGANLINIIVTAEDGSIGVYSVIINRLSGDATIKDLIIKGYELDFKSDIFDYNLEIPDVCELDIEVILNDEKAKYDIIGNKKLDTGSKVIIEVIAEDGTINNYVINITRKLSSDATIKNLNIKGYNLNFISNIYAYQLEIGEEKKLDINVVLNDKRANYKIIGNKNLENGSVIKIEVTAEDGSINNYIIGITKKKKLSSDATIKNINIKGYKLKFSPNNYAYHLTIGNEDKLDINVVLNNSKAKYSIIGNKNLQNGSIISIKVTAEAGNSSTYMIVISRKLNLSATNNDKLSSDVTIKNLTIKGYNIDFNSNIYDYQLEIWEENKLDISVVLNDEKSKYEIIGNENLVDNSLIKIKVIAEDGSIGTYTIKVHKNRVLSDDTSIRNLEIKGYDIDFDSDIYEYSLKIRDEDNLEIKVILNNDKATYKIIGNEKLENGSIIRIRVIAEDGSINNYKINIIKKDKSNVSNFKIIPIIATIIGALIGLGIKIFKGKLTKKK